MPDASRSMRSRSFPVGIVDERDLPIRVDALAVGRHPINRVFSEHSQPLVVATIIEQTCLTIEEVFRVGAAQVWHDALPGRQIRKFLQHEAVGFAGLPLWYRTSMFSIGDKMRVAEVHRLCAH